MFNTTKKAKEPIFKDQEPLDRSHFHKMDDMKKYNEDMLKARNMMK
jgi:hypothetical protein